VHVYTEAMRAFHVTVLVPLPPTPVQPKETPYFRVIAAREAKA